MEYEDYLNAFKRINKMEIITKVSLALGALIMFSAIFTKYPVFIYLLAIGGSFVLFFVIYELIKLIKKKFSYRFVVRAKPVKVKVVKAKKIKEDKEHVIVICPNCNKKIRLPNKKGKHGVCCPICKTDFKVKI